jgi:hypothetical protein
LEELTVQNKINDHPQTSDGQVSFQFNNDQNMKLIENA